MAGQRIADPQCLDSERSAGRCSANSAVVPAGKNSGGIQVFAYGATDVIIDMNWLLRGADFAESVSVSGSKSLYEPGDLFVIERAGRRSLTESHAPYSTLMAGICSTKPGMLATPHSIDASLDGEVPLAIVGIVPCKSQQRMV